MPGSHPAGIGRGHDRFPFRGESGGTGCNSESGLEMLRPLMIMTMLFNLHAFCETVSRGTESEEDLKKAAKKLAFGT